MVFLLSKWNILKDPFSALAFYSVLMVIAPFVGFFATANGYLDPIINLFYTIPDHWEGRGLTSFVASIVSVACVVAAFISHAFNEEAEVTTKRAQKKRM
mmetsp:Transcript_32150/g.91208  ORF Transcript_32150/g.91208 Transcript_32150/m.91208 type:complete len:99 (-) Transcript_32150:643-939(-)